MSNTSNTNKSVILLSIFKLLFQKIKVPKASLQIVSTKL